ncbi:GILT-like protein 1 isoform X2 [Linepithema humile]|uniref:GILT-like protein 1 isoform X2 n=1 Tax=Linepithema humile TaxID=83485 RepID=UPI0006231769|nr:PREDICTED: gamma-interferon-inducible lysosomal thiol reductase isoform X2 [Linepithema humile]
MGLGRRLVIILVVGLLLWQTSKIWLAFLEDGAATQDGQAETALSQKNDSVREKVHVAVYYEALCPDSRSFIIRQLGPMYRTLSANVEIELIPFGKGGMRKTNDGYVFKCQHGPIECKANIIHACSIDVIEDPSIRLQFVTCMIENNIDPVGIMNTCAERITVNLESIKKCSNTQRGKELLAKYGQMTYSLVPQVYFIPTVTLNKMAVCEHFKVIPKECGL